MSRRVFTGKVVSMKMKDTAVVEVERLKTHKVYKKIYTEKKKYKAFVNGIKVKEGDIIKIEESKPVSKTKKWIVKSLVEK